MVVDRGRQENVDIENIKKGYSISRKMAAKLLNVSTRTVDRYVKDNRLSAVTIDGRIWLNKGEISDIRFKKAHAMSNSVVSMSTSNMSIDKHVDRHVDSIDSVDNVHRHQASKKENLSEREEKIEAKLDKQKEEIDFLSQKLKSLEPQLRNSISFSAHHLKILRFEIENKNLEKQLEKGEKINQELNNKFQKTYIKKYIFLILLLFLLALQPLWILIHFDKLF